MTSPFGGRYCLNPVSFPRPWVHMLCPSYVADLDNHNHFKMWAPNVYPNSESVLRVFTIQIRVGVSMATSRGERVCPKPKGYPAILLIRLNFKLSSDLLKQFFSFNVSFLAQQRQLPMAVSEFNSVQLEFGLLKV